MSRDEIILGKRVEDELPEPPDPWDTEREIARKKAKRRDKRGALVKLSRAQLKSGHTHVRGRTRSGKSQLVLLPIILQLLEEYDLTYTNTAGKKVTIKENDTICIFDNGGDRALFNAVKDRADHLGRTFRYLSLESDKSFGFDPFQSIPESDTRLIRLVVMLTEALNLDNGSIYGGAYFTQRNLAQLLAVAEMAVAKKAAGKKMGLAEVDEYIQQERNQIKDADQVRMILRFLARYENLQPQSKDDSAIDFKRAIRDREVIYFFTPTLGEATTARQISGLGLYTAVNAAVDLAESRDISERERPVPHVHLIVDEFQELVGRGFASIMAQAGKFGCSLICANQTTEQLKNRDLSLADIVRDNTATKIYFTCTGKLDTEELQSYSKKARATLATNREGGPFIANAGRSTASESHSEYVTPLLTDNNIIDATATAREFYVIDQTGTGHKEPIRTRAEYVLSEPEYVQFINTPLEKVARLPSDKREEKNPQEPDWQKRHRTTPSGQRLELLQKLYNKVAELRDEQRWT